ncbi:MAG: aminopeptidase P family protein [Candidatus Lambdaproteobacteria bacterium]|nr:aminopeptidase P family protein [Candidatus Lambdaproteobacteria bacterium]
MSNARAHTPATRLEALRALLAEHRLDVYLVPSADEHQNEFVPATAQRRAAVTGFTGSAGDVAVCREQAHLFVDSRYHLQAEVETDPALVRVHKLGLHGEVELTAFLGEMERSQGPLRIGLDPMLHTMAGHEALARALTRPNSKLLPIQDNLVDRVWSDRPAPACSPLFALPLAQTGASVEQKLAHVREAMAEADATLLVLSRLDEVAWLTNLRGRDIPHNPVFAAYAVVTPERAVCFADNPLDGALRKALAPWVRFEPLAAFAERLPHLAQGDHGQPARIWLDQQATSQGVRMLAEGATLQRTAPNPVLELKARKNKAEVAASREAHVRAACAKVRSFAELQRRMAAGRRMSEADYAALLLEHYAREEGFVELSFPTIAGWGPNAAIVHYSTPSPEVLLGQGQMLLVDSGVQIVGATTDDTRTIALGTATPEQRARFTDVLRGHIRLAMQVFPAGTTGQMLDVLARSALWNRGLDYGHGTGHGVGAFLNVHEGPQNISARGSTPLAAGMIVSNEPGYYRAGWGGIRLENLYVVEEAPGLPPHPSAKPWLRFSTLTVIPFDRALIDWGRLTDEERAWLTAYHEQVRATLAPRLDKADKAWLAEACALPA